MIDTQKLYSDIHVVCTSAKENICCRSYEKYAQNTLLDHSKFNIDCVYRHNYDKYAQNTLHDHFNFNVDVLPRQNTIGNNNSHFGLALS